MININKVVLLILTSVLVSACVVSNEKNTGSSIPDLIACKDPRPQICTSEYNPVCAMRKDGSKKTEATGCTACSDPDVVGYVMGVCITAPVD